MSPGHSRLTSSLRPSTVLTAQALQKSNVLHARAAKNANNFPALLKPAKAFTIAAQDSPQPEIDSVVRNDLEAVLKTAALTNEEKYRVLDARDKLIRLTTVRQTDIKKAVATKGTCPDMCPEKERLMREFQRQVSIFEMTEDYGSESTISHKKAIKEYSRSSADQEVPLSHELRSESVLQMTMLYLVHRIMGLCDDPKTSLGEWFHFVWDRTRSIRKDITQQELCSLGAVQLVEQCARFHIHCAARLIAEDPSVFDKKINAENLTKCLQTLKYMYHDLRIKGIYCPCEAEFRSYVILLNLGDSNFLWEVKQLPEFIQKSVEIKRAISFYNALQNNNFVRFFSMIKSSDTSYLSACILLGYFTKLRLRAMDAIIKSHNWRKNDVYLPLSYLTRILGFDDESSAVSFFNHYGLHYDALDSRVLLDRLNKPDIEYAMERALQLVESKRQVSIGECVFGQALPPESLFEKHQPHNSFDVNGVLKIESWTAEDQMGGKSTKGKDQKKEQQELLKKPINPNTESLFKIPKTLLPKAQRQQHYQQVQQVSKEGQKNLLNSLLANKDENCSSSGGFKFGDHIFGGTNAISKTDSIFKSSVSNTNFEQVVKPNTIFKSNTERSITTMGNIFGGIAANGQPKNENIFGVAASEMPNIFQHQDNISIDNFRNDNVFQHFQNKTEKQFFQNISNESEIGREDVQQIEINKRNIALEKELKEKIEQIQDEKIKLRSLREKQKQQEDQERQIEKQRMDKLKIVLQENAEKVTEQFIEDLIGEEVSAIAQAEVLISQMVNQASDLQKDLILSEVVNVCVEDIANEEYALICYDQLLLNRYFSRWLFHLRKKKEQRKLIENTPLWITTNTRAEYALAMEHPCQQKNLELITRYRFGHACDFNKVLHPEQDIFYEINQNPLNLFALVGQHLLSERNNTSTSCNLLQQRKYFKFLITLPGDKEELLGFESFSNKWLLRFIENSQLEAGPFVHGIEHDVALCVRKLNGILPRNEQGNVMTTEGDHNDGVVCFITGIDIDRHSRRRLYNMLKMTKNRKRIPLAIIAYNCICNKDELAEILGLDVLQEEGLIYSYIILGCQTNRKHFSFRKLFINAVDFIAKESCLLNSSEINALAMQNIHPFLEASLGEEMWRRWCDSAMKNPVFNKICSLPQHVVGIFHKALDHLLHITQEDLLDMPEFPQELKEFVPENVCSNVPLGLEFFPVNWKDETKNSIIKIFLESLYLPDVEGKIPSDIEELKLWLLNYSSKCIKDDDNLAATKASHAAITNLVNQIKLQYLQNIELTPNAEMVNYLTIIKPVIFAHINEKLQYFQKDLSNLNVIYLKDDFKNYQTQPWWLNYEPLNLVNVDYSGKLTTLPRQTQEQKNKENYVFADATDEILANAEETSRKAEERLLKLKRKQLFSHKVSSVKLSSTLQLKRTLDDSLYQFELSKKVGQYDISFVSDLTHSIDKSVNDVLRQSSPTTQKRKRSNRKSPKTCSDMEKIILKASNLIQQIEFIEDQKFKIKKN